VLAVSEVRSAEFASGHRQTEQRSEPKGPCSRGGL